MTSNIAKQFVASSVAALVIALTSVAASAQSRLSETQTANEINAANRLLRDGKVEEALAAFRHVVPGDQQRDELNYNMAVAEYRSGNIDAAEKLFNEVAGTSTPAISSGSRYNLGNCLYAKAVQVAEQDKPTAIEHLRDAVSHYRGALRGNSNNPDARANIELAGALIRKLEQEQQDGEQQKSDSKDSKSDQQKKDEQKNQGESSASDKSDKDEQKEDAQQGEKPGDESQKPDDQKSPGEESPSSQQQRSEKQVPPKGTDGKQTQPQNMQTQSGDQQQPDDEEMSEEQEAKNQPVPAGDLKAADEQDEKSRKPVGSGAMADLKAKDELMTREEALKMLQSVRDRDMLRRMQQLRQERSRHVPVDRDW